MGTARTARKHAAALDGPAAAHPSRAAALDGPAAHSSRAAALDDPAAHPSRADDDPLQAIPPPWDYNPSAWRQRVPICLLATAAFFIAAYMGLYQWRLIGSAWDPVFGKQTESVLDSDVSEAMRYWFLVPDAAFGALAYLGDAIFGLAGSTRRWQYRPWLVIIFGIDVIPLGVVSAVLVVLQGLVVTEWCFLCLVTAVISLILVYMAYDEVWSCLLFLHHVWKRTRSRRTLWDAFRGKRSAEIDEVAEEFIHSRRIAKEQEPVTGGNRIRV
jgi:hypothetical protein